MNPHASGTDLEKTPEDALLEAAHRALQTPRSRIAVLLRLSTVPPPGPRRYHRRIAYAILDETAQRYEGQVFLLRNGDALLLCRDNGEAIRPGDPLAQPHALPKIFAQLLEADMPAHVPLTTIWHLEEDAEALLAYAEAGRAGPRQTVMLRAA